MTKALGPEQTTLHSIVSFQAVMLIEVIAFALRLGDNSVDVLFFDPPYHLPKKKTDAGHANRDWGVDRCVGGFTEEKGLKELPRYDRPLEEDLAYMDWCEEWARAFFPKLKPGGFLIAFCSNKTIGYLTVGIRKAGYQIRDQWAYAYTKSTPFGQRKTELDLAKVSPAAARKFKGWKNRLPCSYEPVCIARKPLDGSVAENYKKWGLTGSFNVDGNLLEGRQPTNIMSDDEEDKFFFSGKASEDEKDLSGIWEFTTDAPEWLRTDLIADKGRDWFVDDDLLGFGDDVRAHFQPLKNDHPTIKNTGACEAILKRVVLPGMTVVDAFCGSGSGLVAAARLGCNVLGADNSPRSVRVSQARLYKESLKPAA